MKDIVRQFDMMVRDYRRGSGLDPRDGHSIVIGIDGAVILLRALSWSGHVRMTFTHDEDELVRFDDIPIRLRENATGQVAVLPDHHVPPRSCCDRTAMFTLMIAHSRSNG